jgi:hypothetical protein
LKRALVPAATGSRTTLASNDRCQQAFHRPPHFSSYFIRRRIPRMGRATVLCKMRGNGKGAGETCQGALWMSL